MLRDDLMIVIPDFVFDEGGMRRGIGTVRSVKRIRTYNDGLRKAALDAAFPKLAAWQRTFETDPETIVMLPDGVGVQIKRATLGELRIWQKTHAATTVASWRQFLDTFETIESGMSRVHRLQPMTRLERVKAGREKDPYCPLDPVYGNGIDLAPEFRLRPYREALSLEVDDPTGDDIAADAVRGK